MLSRKTTVLRPKTSFETLFLPPSRQEWKRVPPPRSPKSPARWLPREAGRPTPGGWSPPCLAPLGAAHPVPPAPPLHATRAPSTPARRLRSPEPHGLPGGSPSQPQDTARAGGPAGWGIRYRSSGPIRANHFSLAEEGGGGAAPGDDVRGARLPGGAGRGGKCDVDAGRRGRAAASRGAAGPRAESRPGVLAGALAGNFRVGLPEEGGSPGPPGLALAAALPPTVASSCSHPQEEIRLGRTFPILYLSRYF